MALRLAMLGMWHSHADGIVKQVAAHPEEFSLVGFYEADPQVLAERRGQWASRLPTFEVYDHPDKLLAEKLDGVIVEGRVHDNVAMARRALEAGKHVMLEKPAGTNMADFRALIDLAQRKHLHVQMIYLFRYMSAVQEMFARAKRGQLGRIYSFRARLPKNLSDYQRFVEELKTYPGGMFFEMGGHVIDMMVQLIGPARDVKSILAHHHTAPPESYLDNGAALFAAEHALGVIEVPALEVAADSRRVEVYGTEGAFIIPHLGSGHLKNKNIQLAHSYRKGGGWQEVELPAATLQITDLREFAAVIAGRKEPDFSHQHDLDVHEALLKASGMFA